jgi:hypothetical protein
MLARSRYGQYKECDVLLSKLASEGHPHIHSFYEWINPIRDHPEGSFPFRTGISAVRTAIADIIQSQKEQLVIVYRKSTSYDFSLPFYLVILIKFYLVKTDK